MRCPKCGYISFDKEEICGGCKKNISKFSQEISGVVLRSNVPDFLWFQKPEEEPEPEEDTAEDEQDGGEDIDVSDSTETEDFGAEEETSAGDSMLEFTADSGEGAAEEEAKEIKFDLSMDAGATEAEEKVKEEITFDLPSMEEKETEAPPPEPAPIPPKKEKGDLKLSLEKSEDADEQEQDAAAALDGLDDLDFDLGDASTEFEPAPKKPEKSVPAPKPEKSGKQSKKEPELDLSGLDLSGLMSPVLEEEQSSGGKASGKAGGSKKGKAKSAIDMLPDLSLDLDAPMSPPSSSSAATGKKMAGPAAKTGTALDDFDIDLGDLLGGGGKKK